MITEYVLTKYMAGFTRRLLNLSNSTAVASASTAAAGGVEMLYVHIPFCKELCPFCSFNRTRFEEKTAARYFGELKKELRQYHELGYRFTTLYVGGGTPTVMPDALADLIGYIKELWQINEISVETTPADLSPGIITTLKGIGVNRLSVGVQSFQDALLESVNRIEKYGTGDEIAHRLKNLVGTFDTLNVDLIFGLDNQTLEDVRRDVRRIRDLGIDQVTCYPLMKRLDELPGFRRWQKQMRWEKKAYRIIRDELLPKYRASSAWCFSRDSGLVDEYIVEHPAYAGAGSGAFGYLNGSLTTNLFNLEGYMSRTGSGSLPTLFTRPFSPGEQFRYHLLMQLFRGIIDFKELRNQTGRAGMTQFSRMILRITGAIKKNGYLYQVRSRTAYLTVILMKIFFQGVSSLRGLCMDASERSVAVD